MSVATKKYLEKHGLTRKIILTVLKHLDINFLRTVGSPNSTTYLRGDGTWATPSGSGGGDMTQATYDPDTISDDVFDMDNMKESVSKKIFTSGERSKLSNIEAAADVTDETNVKNALNGATITNVIVAGGDKVLIQDITDSDNLKYVTAQSIADLASGGVSLSQNLKEWTQGKDYEPLVITRDSEGRVTTMTVKWPDGSDGIYTATDYNATHEVYDGYTITHVTGGLTVTQSAVTRNADGAIINKPALTVA